MSQERPEKSDNSVEKIDKPITNAQKERKRQKNKARREKRRQAKSLDTKDKLSHNDTLDANSTTQDKRSIIQKSKISDNDSKVDSKNVANNTINRKKGASKKRKRTVKNKTPQIPERVTFKLTVRRLPPNLKEDSFWNVVYTNFPDFKELVHSYYYVNGYLPQTQFENPVFSRCYIDCTDEQSMMIIGKGVKTLTFTNNVEGQTKKDENGSEVFEEEMEVYVPSVEKSFYQKMPQGDIEPFPENGSITKNPHCNLFVELLKEEGRREMPKNIFEYIIELKQKKKSERRKQKKANAKAANLKNDRANKSNEKTTKVNDAALKKTKKKKPKKKTKSDDKQVKPNSSSSSDERKPIKFTLKKKPVA